MNMTKVNLFVCIIWVALSLGLLGCQRPSNIKFDETGFYILKEKEEDSIIDMREDTSIPRIRPYFEGYGRVKAQRRGMVPDKETAIKIAESVWYPIYGSQIYTEQPFVAELEGDTVWVVRGSLPKGRVGGCAEIRLRKSDAAVLNVNHEK
jgi:hypothetical protein